MLNEWCYIGKPNEYFTCGESYKLDIEADKRNEELVFNIHFDRKGFVISKEYVGFESFFKNWCPVEAINKGASCKDFEDSLKYMMSLRIPDGLHF